MDPAQQAQAITRRIDGQVNARLLRTELGVFDRLDKQSFDQFTRDHPGASKFTSQVEQVLASERQAGRNPTRETIVKYLIGEDFLRRSQTTTARERTQQQRRIAAQTTRPTNARSTVPAGERRPGSGPATEAEIEERWGETPL